MKFPDLNPFWEISPRILIGISILIGIYLLLRVTQKALLSLPLGKRKNQVTTAYLYFKWGLWLIGLLVILQQLGIRLDFLNRIILIAFALFLGTMGLTLALSAFLPIRWVILSHFLKKEIPNGSYIQTGEYTGRVISWTAQSLQLETDNGRASIPFGYLEKKGFIILRRDPNRE